MKVIIFPLMRKVDEFSYEYPKYILGWLRRDGVEAEIDERDKKLWDKIQDAIGKVDYMIMLGDKEEIEGLISIRDGENNKIGTFNYDCKFQDLVKKI
jgi:threonyl-tRNA synthetase